MNGGGIRIGRIFGIPIVIDTSWLVIFFLIVFYFWGDLVAAERQGGVEPIGDAARWLIAVLGALLFRSLRHELQARFWLVAMITLAAGTAFGAFDEWHQSFTGRTPEVWDIVADAAGLACGTLLVLLVQRRSARRAP